MYGWTGENNYIVRGGTSSLVVGSSQGHFGLWLDENFNMGRSMAVSTFRSGIYCMFIGWFRIRGSVTDCSLYVFLYQTRDSCKCEKIYFFNRGNFLDFSCYVLYLTLLQLPPLRFHCVGGCWDRTQDCRDFEIGSQTDALTSRPDLIHNRPDLIYVFKCWSLGDQRSRCKWTSGSKN